VKGPEFEPNAMIYVPLFRTYIHYGTLPEVLAFWEEMKKSPKSMTTRTCGGMLYYLGQQKHITQEYVSRAIHLFLRCSSESLSLSLSLFLSGICLSIFAFTQ
jgi:hypothetical protein